MKKAVITLTEDEAGFNIGLESQGFNEYQLIGILERVKHQLLKSAENKEENNEKG